MACKEGAAFFPTPSQIWIVHGTLRAVLLLRVLIDSEIVRNCCHLDGQVAFQSLSVFITSPRVHTSVILALQRQRQEDRNKFEANWAT